MKLNQLIVRLGLLLGDNMREIKFRAWIKKEKKMLKHEEILYDGPLQYPKESGLILMQYTGLKDKNGKEIYEGDIVTIIFDKNWSEKYPDTQDVGEVIFDNGTFCARKGKEKIRAWKDGVHDWHSLENVEELEVIGNIYENPKMVKK